MRKFFIALLSAVCLACLGAFFACGEDNAPDYYTFTYRECDGITVECEIPSGYLVRSGAEVTFSLNVDESVLGEPTVTLNGETLPALADAEKAYTYSFKMTGDSAVVVKTPTVCNVNFAQLDNIEFTSLTDDVSVEDGGFVLIGTQVSFSLWLSPYYDRTPYDPDAEKGEDGEDLGYKVMAGNVLIYPDDDGVYTFTALQEETTVTLTNLVFEEDFVARGEGSGTKDDPYIIRCANDLNAMRYYINGSWASGYNYAYYRMEADIDLEGDRLYVIGDMTTSSAVFCGVFDGNGHTVRNFYIQDTTYTVDDSSEAYLTNLGMFGVVMGTSDGGGVVTGLTIDNFTIEADATKAIVSEDDGTLSYGANVIVGGLVGYGVGANISDCSATAGVITIDADDEKFAYAGGLVGMLEAYMSSYDGTLYFGGVQSCYTDVKLSCASGFAYSFGGVVGYLSSASDYATAFVINSYSTGQTSGAIATGGVVGYLAGYSSVSSCYSTGYADAVTRISVMGTASDVYAYSYGGGIVGFAEYSSVVSDSFSSCVVSATAASGREFANSGAVVGGMRTAFTSSSVPVNGGVPTVINCYSGSDVTLTAAFFEAVNFDAADWTLTAGGYPVINRAPATKEATLTVDFGGKTVNGESTYTADISNSYIPMAYWYMLTIGVPEFADADDGSRSYGYFFDAALTQPVYCGYVPTHDITVYAGFADYGEVAGTYYFTDSAYVELGGDGTLIFRDGAIGYQSSYTYDGGRIVMEYTVLALLAGTAESYSNYIATVSDGVMTVKDNVTFTTDATALKAVKKNASFQYGTYYGTSNGQAVTYVFNQDGTGTYTVGTTTESLTFTVSDTSIDVKMSSGNYTAAITDGKVTMLNSVSLTAVDQFEGVWEKSATSHKVYTFDGKGNYSYEYFGYDADGVKKVIETYSGTYTVDGNELAMTVNGQSKTAYFDADGILVIVSGNGHEEKFAQQNSFMGVWNYESRTNPVSVELYGVTSEGFGYGVISYGISGTSFDVSYQAVSKTVDGKTVTVVEIYDSDVLVASLTYLPADGTLVGSVFDMIKNMEYGNAVFTLYDDFKGEWISANGDLSVVSFNGYGSYQLVGVIGMVNRTGTVTVNGVTAGSYTLNDSTMTGTFAYNGVTYNISYNEENGCIDVTFADGSGDAFAFVKADEWYGLTLADDDGNVYTFDGMGALDTATPYGTMTVKGTDGETTYAYLVSGEGIALYSDGSEVGSIVGFTLTLNSQTTTLTYRNDFVGNWTMSAIVDESALKKDVADAEGYSLTIGKIGADCTATGTFLGVSVTYTYDPASKSLSFPWNNGATLYVFAYTDNSGTELAVTPYNNKYQEYVLAFPEGRTDGFGATYTAKDGATVTLDGHGDSRFGTGYAVVRDADGTVVQTYTYTVNTFGVPELMVSASSKLLFVETEETADGAYGYGGAWYAITAPDFMYLRTAYVYNADGSVARYYLFDGLGHVRETDRAGATEGKIYSYKEIGRDSDEGIVNFEFTSEDGNVYFAACNYTDLYISMDMSDEWYGKTAVETVGETEKTYAFDGFGTVTCSDGTSYSYEVVASGDGTVSFRFSTGADNGYLVVCTVTEDTVTLQFSSDSLYGVTATETVVNDDGGTVEKTYEFDGNGTVTCSDGTSYSYEVVVSGDETVSFRFSTGADNGYLVVCTVLKNTVTLQFSSDSLYGVTATETVVNDDGGTVEKTYEFDGNGTVTCSDGTSYSYKVVASGDGTVSFRFSAGEYNNYLVVCTVTEDTVTLQFSSDSLYGVMATETVVNDDGTVEQTYLFDGNGTVTCSDGTSYSYIVVASDEAAGTTTFTFTASDGKVYGAVAESKEDGTLTITVTAAESAGN